MVNIYDDLIADTTNFIPKDILQKYFTDQLYFLLEFKPQIGLDTVLQEHQKWRSVTANQDLCLFILKVSFNCIFCVITLPYFDFLNFLKMKREVQF